MTREGVEAKIGSTSSGTPEDIPRETTEVDKDASHPLSSKNTSGNHNLVCAVVDVASDDRSNGRKTCSADLPNVLSG